MNWNLDQLQLFVRTAESRSFSAAARQTGRAQSAVSTAIALLESDLGVTLFERSTAGFAWLKENLKPGDLVHVRGRIGESNYAKDGQTVYQTSLTADRFAVVPVGKDG